MITKVEAQNFHRPHITSIKVNIMDVEVRSSPIAGAGRGLFALKDFAPGDLVLSLERPYVAELDIDRLSDTCAWCFQRGATDANERSLSQNLGLPAGFIETKACTGCKRVRYCSKICQTKAWSNISSSYENSEG